MGGELARFEMSCLGRNNSRVDHFLDLFAHEISVIAMFAIGWAVANSTGNELYSVASFALCFFIMRPVNESANQVVIEEAKQSS
ncbi:MAG TPA: hypothetical protein EYQ81_12565 [Sneathiellales bacterium]|nr:hypothetical protein [Sneathiellales bacterium]